MGAPAGCPGHTGGTRAGCGRVGADLPTERSLGLGEPRERPAGSDCLRGRTCGKEPDFPWWLRMSPCEPFEDHLLRSSPSVPPVTPPETLVLSPRRCQHGRPSSSHLYGRVQPTPFSLSGSSTESTGHFFFLVPESKCNLLEAEPVLEISWPSEHLGQSRHTACHLISGSLVVTIATTVTVTIFCQPDLVSPFPHDLI